MKELTITEKAQKYDEAIRKAKDMLSYKEVRQEDMEYLFPELKELEDERKNNERLRKTSIAFLKEFADKGYENAVECIDWLKKQDNQKPQGETALEAIKAMKGC